MRSIVAVAVLAVLAGAAIGAGSLATSPPAADPVRLRMAALDWLHGEWTCGGKIGDAPTTFSLVFSDALMGAWLDMRMDTGQGKRSFQLVSTIGYSESAKEWIRFDRTATGRSRLLTSAGPEGETITFTEVEPRGAFREKFARTKEGFLGEVWLRDAGKWTTAATFACGLR